MRINKTAIESLVTRLQQVRPISPARFNPHETATVNEALGLIKDLSIAIPSPGESPRETDPTYSNLAAVNTRAQQQDKSL